MTRRQLLLAAATVPLAAGITGRQSPYGFVDVGRAAALNILPARIWCNGVEVKECTAFDDRAGYAEQFVTDAEGRLVLYPETMDRVQTRRVYGAITIQPNAPDLIQRGGWSMK